MTAPFELMRFAAGSIVTAAWEGLLLAGVVAVCLRMLPGISAAARSVVWLAVMVTVCGLPFVHVTGHASGTGAGPVRVDERIGLVLVGVWALISLVRAAQLVRSAVWLRGISRRAVPVSVTDSVARILGDGSHGRDAELCVSEEVDRPCVVGFFRPRVLVPAALLKKLAAGELEQIVLHEMEHLRRGDDWTNLLQKLSLVAFPLNPALIWIERQLCLERELACDDRVLKATGARKAYAACLANLAEHSLVRRGVSLALGAWERQSEVVRRVHRILAGSRDGWGRRQVAGVVAVLMAGVLAGADGLAHAPALVSFGPAVRSSEVASAGQAERFPQKLKPTLVQASYGGTEVSPLQNSSASRATLVKAVMPVRHVRPAKKVNTPVVDAMKRASTNIPALGRLVDEEPMVVMVTWQMGSPVIVRDSQFVYAAVPTRDGWMFVQL